MAIPALPMATSLAQRLRGRPLVLLLDVDGTLSPIAPRPEYATVPRITQALLRELAKLPLAHVVIMTGREVEDARRLVGVDGLWIIGNHGFEIARPNESAIPDDRVQAFSQVIAQAAERCQAIARADPGIIVENKRLTLSIHYRLAHPRVVPEIRARVDALARELGLRVMSGKEVVELRPPIDIDKGTAATTLAAELGALRSGASLLCAGDDRTDEDAFRALRAAQPACVTVHIESGSAPLHTLAEFYVRNTEEMRDLLQAVLALRTGASA